jgi:tetratricopeptide (TPR) repeat protein
VICSVVLAAASCESNVRPVSQVNANAAVANREKPQTAIAHSSENKMPPSYPSNSAPAGGGRWSAGGEAIDTAKLDASVTTAEKALAGKPTDASMKKAVGEAYLARAVALTEARQYASALGDYRKTLKYDASNPEAKQWIEQMTSIYGSMGRAAPKEGEEPPPMPFNKK